jgi:hypothetical protein
MKCRKCGKKIVILNGKTLDRAIHNTTDLCDECLRQEEEKKNRKPVRNSKIREKEQEG